MPLINGAQHSPHRLLGQIAGAVSNRLIGQRQGIAHRTRCRLTKQTQGGDFEGDPLLSKNVFEVTDNRLARHLL